jgi:hypothetical protein
MSIKSKLYAGFAFLVLIAVALTAAFCAMPTTTMKHRRKRTERSPTRRLQHCARPRRLLSRRTGGSFITDYRRMSLLRRT